MAYIFDIKVVPSSGKNKWVLDKSGMLKGFLKSPPEKGLANKELVKLLAKALGLTQSEVAIVAGETSRRKRIRIQLDITYDELLSRLGIERQASIW